MPDRVPEMVDFLARRLGAMMARKRRPGSDPAADLQASLLRRWPDITPFELAAATLGLAERLWISGAALVVTEALAGSNSRTAQK